MSYRVRVTFDDELVLDETVELEGWAGFDAGLPGNVAVAVNAKNQEHPPRAQLDRALALLDESGEDTSALRARLLALLPRDEPPVFCFSYDDPGPARKDGTPVRTNIEREILPGARDVFLVSRRPNEAPEVTHEYAVSVEEV